MGSGDEKEIYKALYKKKEIDDKTPKLRTEDEKNMLKSLSNKIRYFPKDLIDGIKKKFPDLQRTPKTAEKKKKKKKKKIPGFKKNPKKTKKKKKKKKKKK